jgi:hypothetical protein
VLKRLSDVIVDPRITEAGDLLGIDIGGQGDDRNGSGWSFQRSSARICLVAMMPSIPGI